MRSHSLRFLLLSTALAALALAAPRVHAADPDFTGTWKIVILGPFSENELLLLDVKDEGGKAVASVKDFSPQQFQQAPKATNFGVEKGVVTLGLNIGIPITFTGKSAKDGSVSGVLKINNQVIPARFVKTDAKKVKPLIAQEPESSRIYSQARGEQNPKSKSAKLTQIIGKNPGNPSLVPIYIELFNLAEAAGLSPADVRKLANEEIEVTKLFGSELATSAALGFINTLSKYKTYASIALDLAKAVETDLAPDATLETRANTFGALAAAARAAGDKTLMARAEAQVQTLNANLDEEYHKTVPPFKPEVSGAGKDRKSNRVVLMELFTGAQCPPCVAADVAFDVLIDTYKPTELVTLQYHEHIPGPDPLTNSDSVARFQYYPDSQGTPTTLFNGKTEAGGGGPMSNAKAKYDEFKGVIDKSLEKPSEAKINLNADRKGDGIVITASAQAEDAKNENLKLRLVLVEDQVRYTGGNNLRFHHHVVRGFPGGVEGKTLSKGQGKTEVTVNLADVRKGLEAYLGEFAKGGRAFPKALPPIDLNKLSIVAFVQDDSNKSVLNAAMTAVAEKTPTP